MLLRALEITSLKGKEGWRRRGGGAPLKVEFELGFEAKLSLPIPLFQKARVKCGLMACVSLFPLLSSYFD